MSPAADARFLEQAQQLGYSFDGDIKIGGNYMPWVRDGQHFFISGQISLGLEAKNLPFTMRWLR